MKKAYLIMVSTSEWSDQIVVIFSNRKAAEKRLQKIFNDYSVNGLGGTLVKEVLWDDGDHDSFTVSMINGQYENYVICERYMYSKEL